MKRGPYTAAFWQGIVRQALAGASAAWIESSTGQQGLGPFQQAAPSRCVIIIKAILQVVTAQRAAVAKTEIQLVSKNISSFNLWSRLPFAWAQTAGILRQVGS